MSDDLPDHVVQEILSRLSVKEVVRTTVLSRAWRHSRRWQSVPVLSFDEYTPVAVIDEILLAHSAPIKGLSIDLHVEDDDREACTNYSDRWLVLLSRRHPDALTSLSLILPPIRLFKTPISSLLLSSFRSLTYLSLKECSLSPPVGLPTGLPTGFPLLRTLILNSVALSDEHHLSALISGCPSLEDLSLTYVYGGFGHLRIHNPKLRSFHLYPVSFGKVTFAGGQNLAKVSLRGMDYRTLINLCDFFGNSVCNGTLDMSYVNINELVVPERILFNFHQLAVLTMEVDWEENSYIHIFLSLLRSAPNLRHLCLILSLHLFFHASNIGMPQWKPYFDTDHHLINNGLQSEEDFWNQQGIDRLDKLRTLEMRQTVFTASEMGFMQFVLTRAPVLEKLILVSATDSIIRDETALKVLDNCHKSSTKVQIRMSR